MIAKSTASQIYNLGGTYTTLPNESLLAIRDAAAIGVWAYLVSKNESWRLERSFLCEELGLNPTLSVLQLNLSKSMTYVLKKRLGSLQLNKLFFQCPQVLNSCLTIYRSQLALELP